MTGSVGTFLVGLGVFAFMAMVALVAVFQRVKSMLEGVSGNTATPTGGGDERLERLRQFRSQLRDSLRDTRSPPTQPLSVRSGGRVLPAEVIFDGDIPVLAAAPESSLHDAESHRVPTFGEIGGVGDDGADSARPTVLESRPAAVKLGSIRGPASPKRKAAAETAAPTLGLSERLSPLMSAFIAMEVFGPPRSLAPYRSPDET